MSHFSIDTAPLADLTAATLWSAVLSMAIFLVAFEQGLLTAGVPIAHELFHDGRHLLGVPCH